MAPQWQPAEELVLHVFEITQGPNISARAVAADGSETTFSCRRSGNNITLEACGNARNVKVILRATRDIKAVSNGRNPRQLPEGALMEWSDPTRPLVIAITD
jgi:hypothetical protein